MSTSVPVVPQCDCVSSPWDDRELMHRIRADDTRALDAAVQRYWKPLVAFAHRMLGWTDGAEDAVQDAFVSLWEHRTGWQPSDSLRALLYRIVRNNILNEQRRRRVRIRWLTGDQQARKKFNPTPLDDLEEGELAVAVSDAIEALPARRREVFILARFQDLSYREIAVALGISPQTVANQMSAAMEDLRRSLGAYLRETPQPKGGPDLDFAAPSARRLNLKVSGR